MYWESNQQQFKFSPCSGQKEKVEKKGGGQQSTNNIGAPQFFVRRWKEESPSQYAEIVIEPNIIALTKENLYQLGTQYLVPYLPSQDEFDSQELYPQLNALILAQENVCCWAPWSRPKKGTF